MSMIIFFICTAIFLYNIYSLTTASGDIDWSSKALSRIFNEPDNFEEKALRNRRLLTGRFKDYKQPEEFKKYTFKLIPKTEVMLDIVSDYHKIYDYLGSALKQTSNNELYEISGWIGLGYKILASIEGYVKKYNSRSYSSNQYILSLILEDIHKFEKSKYAKKYNAKSFRHLEDTIKEFSKALNKPPKNIVMNQSDILINTITEKNSKLNNTISNSLLGTARDLHSLFTQYNDESSQKEIIRQLEAISEFLDTQIEKACLPGSQAYINKTLSTSSFYIKSVIENDNWVE